MCTPTGSGKTTIAELAVLRTLYRKVDEAPDAPKQTQDGFCAARALPGSVACVGGRSGGTAFTRYRLDRFADYRDRHLWWYGLEPHPPMAYGDGPTVLVCTVEMAETLLRYAGSLLILSSAPGHR